MTSTSPLSPAFARESRARFWLTLSTCDAPVVDDPVEPLRADLTSRRRASVTERDGTCTATVIFCVWTTPSSKGRRCEVVLRVYRGR